MPNVPAVKVPLIVNSPEMYRYLYIYFLEKANASDIVGSARNYCICAFENVLEKQKKNCVFFFKIH